MIVRRAGIARRMVCCSTFCHHGTFGHQGDKTHTMPARFVTNEMVTNRAAIVPF